MANESKILTLEDRRPTWENLGIDVTGSRNISEVIKNAHLDYEVEKRELAIAGTNLIIPDKMATVRTTDDHIYGVVSPKYSIIQNEEAFDFVNYINGELEFVKAGETKGGCVYIIARLPEQYVLGDAVAPYVLFRNSFNGRFQIQSAVAPLRIVCQNQLTMAFKSSANTINIRHSRNAEAKMLEARQILRHATEYMNTLNSFAESMVSKKVDDVQFGKLMDTMFATTEDMSARRVTAIETDRASFITAYNADDNANFKGTAWGVINGASDYITHKPIQHNSETAEETRFIATTFAPEFLAFLTQQMQAVV